MSLNFIKHKLYSFQLKRRDSPHPTKQVPGGGSTSSSGGSQENQEAEHQDATATTKNQEETKDNEKEEEEDLELRRNSTEEVAQELFANIEQFTMQAKQAAEQGSLELGKAFR